MPGVDDVAQITAKSQPVMSLEHVIVIRVISTCVISWMRNQIEFVRAFSQLMRTDLCEISDIYNYISLYLASAE